MGEDVLDLRDAEARPRDVPRALERVLDERRDELRVGRVAGAGHGDDSRVPAEHGDRVPLRVEVAAEELEEKSQEVAERVVVPLERAPLVGAAPQQRVAASDSRGEARPPPRAGAGAASPSGV